MMGRSKSVFAGLMVGVATLGSPTFVFAGSQVPVVVELFTSQGCSSCPPANANLIKLSRQPDVLTLSFAVTYWDYLGWKDRFGKPEFTDRQAVYEPPLGQDGPYTPQMVVNGAQTTVGNDFSEVRRLVRDTAPLNGPAIILRKTKVEIDKVAGVDEAADVWLVRYDPNVVQVPVERGENAGTTLPHTHVVHSLQHLGLWDGAAVSYDISPAPLGLRTAILVQRPDGRSILAAATD
jgi:hypothetical protein